MVQHLAHHTIPYLPFLLFAYSINAQLHIDDREAVMETR